MDAETIQSAISRSDLDTTDLLEIAVCALSRLSDESGQDVGEDDLRTIDEAVVGRISALAIDDFKKLGAEEMRRVIEEIAADRDLGDAACTLLVTYWERAGQGELDALLNAFQRDIKSRVLNRL